MILNKEFLVAADFVQYTQEHIFLTGKAGTGKTTFLRHIINNCHKKLIVTAPTGVAAINAGGVTLHSLFQLPIGTYIADYKKNWGYDADNFIINKHQLLSKIRINTRKRRLLQELELLIIDEISMVRADTLDAIDTLLKSIRKMSDVPFGGVQLLMIGDLYQLPPVVRNHELAVMHEYYNSPFFFDAISLREIVPITVELQTIYRQDDEAFINLLNNIRNNVVDEHDYEYLHTRYFPNYQSDLNDSIITLTSHNATADEINAARLEQLTTKSIKYQAEIKGEFPESMYPTDVEVAYKVGAQIMFIKNDVGEDRRYYNGKIGIIEAFDEEDKLIKINFPKEKNSLWIGMEQWENVKFKFIEEKETIDSETVGTFSQFPFKLAWAVTIHKSQGLTFDEAIIDAGRSFAPGQVYVALSRMTSMKGMILKSKISPASISVDERIVRFMNNVKKVDIYQDRLLQGKIDFLINNVKALFLYYQEWDEWHQHNQMNIAAMTSELITMSDGYRTVQSIIIQWDAIRISFHKQIDQLLWNRDWASLHARIQAAAAWFEDRWKLSLLPALDAWLDRTTNESGGKVAKLAIKNIKNKLSRKIRLLSQAVAALHHFATQDNIDEALTILISPTADTDEQQSEKPVEKKKGGSAELSIQMFKGGMSIKEIARERTLVESTILGHLALGVKDGVVSPDKLMDMKLLMSMIDILAQHPDAKWSEAKALFPEDVTYPEIKIASCYREYLESQKNISQDKITS